METIKNLQSQLQIIRVIAPGKNSSTTKGTVITVNQSAEMQNYLQLVLDLAVEFNNFLQYFRKKVWKAEMKASEAEDLNKLIEGIILYFEETNFLRGVKSQTWIDMVYLFFGTTIYNRTLLRNTGKTIEVFLVCESLIKLEKVIYNKCYYSLLDKNC